jgi:alkylation response protein AidB-like acyl-CoA dehydrogenase
MLLDASRAMAYTTCLAVQSDIGAGPVRRLVSETKKFVTESCQKVVHNAMQVMGGIGYTNVYPVERIHRDLRLASIWTGTNEVMAMIAASEWYREDRQRRAANATRDSEPDAAEADAEGEKVFE